MRTCIIGYLLIGALSNAISANYVGRNESSILNTLIEVFENPDYKPVTREDKFKLVEVLSFIDETVAAPPPVGRVPANWGIWN